MDTEDIDNFLNNRNPTTTVAHDPPQSSTVDLKLDLLANQLKVNVMDSETSSDVTSIVEVIDDDQTTVMSPKKTHHNQKTASYTSPTVNTPKGRNPDLVKPPPSPIAPKKPVNEKYRKVELLRIFQELEQKGIKLSTTYTIHSSLEDMEQEYEILKSLETKKQAVRLYKGFMVNGIQMLEFLNESYNPFEFHLKGWSEHVSLSIDEYDEVLSEIYEKWKHTGRKLEPELKLVVMLTMSATTFHAHNTLLQGLMGSRRKKENAAAQEPPPQQQRPSPPQENREPMMRGPDPKEFLDRLRKSQPAPQPAPRVPMKIPQHTTRPPATVVKPIVLSDVSSDTSSTDFATSTTSRRKKPITIQM